MQDSSFKLVSSSICDCLRFLSFCCLPSIFHIIVSSEFLSVSSTDFYPQFLFEYALGACISRRYMPSLHTEHTHSHTYKYAYLYINTGSTNDAYLCL